MRDLSKLVFCLAAALLSIFFASCSSSGNDDEKLITFHIGTSRNISTGLTKSLVTMPQSGFTLVVDNDPFMYSGDLNRVDVAKIIMPASGMPLFGFLFDCNDSGVKKLYYKSASNMGGYIVMLYQGAPVGLRKIDAPIDNGELFIVPELPLDTDLQEKADDMNASIKAIGEIVKKKREENSGIF